MKIYLAGSCAPEQRNLMVTIAKYIRQTLEDFCLNNNAVFCPFELNIPNAWDMSQEEWSKRVFEADRAAIDNCDLFLMISQGRISSAGTNWEQGYAYGIDKKTAVIQITDEPTSLMSYVGCDVFVNSNKEDLFQKIDLILSLYIESKITDGTFCYRPACETVLT